MQFKAFEEGIEINGQTVYGKWLFGMDAWYPRQTWLDGFAAIPREVGEGVLYKTLPQERRRDLHVSGCLVTA